MAYSTAVFEAYVRGTGPQANRFIEQWARPIEIAPGLTLALRIVTPSSAVTTIIEPASPRDIIWLPKAPDSQSTSIAVLFSKPTALTDGWPGQQSMGTSLIGSIRLNNGEIVWAVYMFEPTGDLGIKAAPVYFYKGMTKEDLDRSGLRALIFGYCPDGSRAIVDWDVKR